LASPFTSDDLRVHLTALASPAEKGSSINTLLHFDARDLSFSEAPDGSRTAEGDIVAVTFNAEGEQVDTVARGWKVTVPREDYDKVTEAGFVFAAILPVKKSGGYQLRAVVRDSGSQRIGSAMQFVEIPDVSKGRLTLSGILMGAENVPRVGDSAGRERVEGTPAVRIFRSGSTVNYAYQILNARVDVDKKPQLESQIRLFRDGQMVYASHGSALASDPQNNPKRLIATGRFQLNRIPPGNYTFQLIVEDNLRHDKYARAVQAIDFQVRE
jgi:hypothetical protein